LDRIGQATLDLESSQLNISTAIDLSAFKEIGTRNYWINNSLEINNFVGTKNRNIRLRNKKFW
jgi:hypothetical protein